jgi:hypothetical protein
MLQRKKWVDYTGGIGMEGKADATLIEAIYEETYGEGGSGKREK